MTKEQMLDIVNLKMAPTSYSDGGTGCFLPVMIGDVLDWIEKNPSKKPKAPITAKLSHTSETVTKMKIAVYWKEKQKPIDDQSEECISYVYSLIK